jgi:ABC-type antimicrobial peptide transport system permease subunit
VSLAVRTTGDPLAMAPAIRGVIHRVDPAQPVGNIRSLEDVIAGSVADRRMRTLLIGSFAGLALALALLGLVAALGRAVTERGRELAIRAALGSSPGRTVRLVVANGAVLVGLGIAAGLVTAAIAARGLAGMLYGLGPRDPLTHVGAAIIVALAGLAGCYLAARRATLINTAELLRSE